MNKHILTSLAGVAAVLSLTTGCVEEFEPQNATVTADQAAAAPGAYNNFVAAVTSSLAGQFTYSSSQYPFDFGYSSFFIVRDVQGHDNATRSSWYSYWYECLSQAPTTAICQLPWTCYFSYINNCNTVIGMAKASGSDDMKDGLGQAYAIRAMLYMDLAQMYGSKSYGQDKECLTVPIVTDETAAADLTHNPNATNAEIYAFILSDLDLAEQNIGSENKTVYTPTLSFIYGLKARAYLLTEDWANAEKYAKLAQEGHTVMSADQYTDWETGFNTANDAWIFALRFQSTDECILNNDADSSWGSQMFLEIDPKASGCGYAANYGQPHAIDRHLYETIPATDCRKKCYIDFAIDNMKTAEATEALKSYSNHPDWLLNAAAQTDQGEVGGLELKFRTAGGETGRANQMVGFCCDVPVMRVEEMILIEAEAQAMQGNTSAAQTTLTNFALTRDPSFVYGQHNETYGNASTPAIVNEIWWQRRVELWGEGFATFDIKRLNKSVIRSYTGTNHIDGYQWNTEGPAPWMSLTIVQTETNYNTSCVSNPTPSAPNGNSAPYTF